MKWIKLTFLISIFKVKAEASDKTKCLTKLENVNLKVDLGKINCFKVDDLERCWIERKPEGHKRPLLIDLHGYTACAENSSYNGWSEIVEREDIYHVLPQGLGEVPGWNAGACCGVVADTFPLTATWKIDDVNFISNLVRHLYHLNPHKIDGSRIYLTGHSNGCAMSQRLAYEQDWMAGVACSSFYLLGESKSSEIKFRGDYVPKSIMEVHGVADEVVGYTPNFLYSSYFVTGNSAKSNADIWRKENKCNVALRLNNSTFSKTFDTEIYTACENQADVQLVSIYNDTGHMAYKTGVGSKSINQAGSVPVTEIQWEFLKKAEQKDFHFHLFRNERIPYLPRTFGLSYFI